MLSAVKNIKFIMLNKVFIVECVFIYFTVEIASIKTCYANVLFWFLKSSLLVKGNVK